MNALAFQFHEENMAANDNFARGTKTRYVTSATEEIADLDGNRIVLRRYIAGPAIDERVAQVDATGNVTYIHTDKQNSVVALSNSSGTAISRRGYGTYGETNPTQMAETTHPFGYTGRRWEADLGLYYYRARWYDPELGTFLETDPIGSLDYVNLYSYVGLEPMDKIDPTGMQTVSPVRTPPRPARTLGRARSGNAVTSQSLPIGRDPARPWEYEGYRGSHVETRHIGRDNNYLRSRFSPNNSLQRSSTFESREGAERAINSVLKANEWKVAKWLLFPNGERQLSLHTPSNITWTETNGTVMLRNGAIVPPTGVTVILRSTTDFEQFPAGYYVYTAYPTFK